MQRAHAGLVADKRAKLCHFCKHHGHNLKAIDLVGGVFTGLARLNDQHAQYFAQPLDWHAQKAGKDLFASFGHIAKTTLLWRVVGIDQTFGARHAAYKPLTKSHTGLVDSFGVQALCGTKLKGVIVAKQVDRAHICAHALGNQLSNVVHARLAGAVAGHSVAQCAKQLAAFALRSL